MKIVLTGGTGLLGQAFLQMLGQEHPDWQVTFLSRKPSASGTPPNWKSLDISDFDATYQTITKLNPDVVIHAAAIRSPDDCERNPREAFRVNFIGTRNVALSCDRFDTELVFISSDQVFYGAGDKAHQEYDALRATNLYGQTKILGEEFIKQHLRRWWIVRTAKLFGGPADKVSFIHCAFEALSANKTLNVVKEWAAHTTHAFFMSQAIAQLIMKKVYGIYHVVSPGVPTCVEIGEFMARELGKPHSLLARVSQKELSLLASRAAHLELSNQMWREDFGQELPSWQDGIKRFLQERRLGKC